MTTRLRNWLSCFARPQRAGRAINTRIHAVRRCFGGTSRRSSPASTASAPIPKTKFLSRPGATEALMAAFRSLVEPGDAILAFSPVYENYFHQARLAGLSLKTVPLVEPDFAVQVADLEAACSDRVRAILICNPCNPTGKVFSRDELELISEFAERRNLLILSDEAYESFIWRGTHVSIGSLAAQRRAGRSRSSHWAKPIRSPVGGSVMP